MVTVVLLCKYIYSRMHTNIVKNLITKSFQMLFQSMHISNFAGKACPHADPLAAMHLQQLWCVSPTQPY